MFTTQAGLSGREQADITGLIGQYAHGNEPSHHMAYLYNYIGKPYKTQKLVRQIMNDLYGTDPAGLCGNEDCGQMSAWFVMSAMGLYPVTPGIGYYSIGSPLFEEIKIHYDIDKLLIINAKNNNATNIYIQSAGLNGNEYDKSYFSHQDIINGGTLVLEMGSEPNSGWAADSQSRPVSAITEYLITPVPYFAATSGSFQEKLVVSLKHPDPDAGIYYNIGSKNSGQEFDLYKEPLTINATSTISAYASGPQNNLSKTTTASFFQINHGWKVSIKNPYSNQYTGGGDMALVDGQHGGANFRTGSWQGYQGVDVEATVDMGEIINIREVSATFLQDQKSWIFMPERVEFAVSVNNNEYYTVGLIENITSDSIPDAVIKDFTKKGLKEKGRYIRMRAHNRGTCPDWHVGAGDKAWIFIDEITVE